MTRRKNNYRILSYVQEMKAPLEKVTEHDLEEDWHKDPSEPVMLHENHSLTSARFVFSEEKETLNPAYRMRANVGEVVKYEVLELVKVDENGQILDTILYAVSCAESY